MERDTRCLAETVFRTARYLATDEEINILAANMELLEQRGLSELNCRLLAQKRDQVWDAITEHNFATKVAKLHLQEVPILYEPCDGLGGRPDFRIEIAGTVYWVQIKNLSRLERDNRQAKLIDRIRDAAKAIEIGEFFSIDLAEDFADDEILALVEAVKEKARTPGCSCSNPFPSTGEIRATFDIYPPCKRTLSHLTLGISSDMDWVEVTGKARDQIVQSLTKAVKAFDWPLSQDTINLVAFDCSKYRDIHVTDAVFGTEYEVISGVYRYWDRRDDGFFHNPDFSRKVAGVIGLRRMDRSPVSDYRTLLYINEAVQEREPQIHRLLPCDMVVHSNMRPQGSDW